MKHIEEYLNDVIKVEPLGKLTTMDDNLYGMSGEMVYIDGKCSGIFISHADYVNWLEKQDEQTPADNVEPKFNPTDEVEPKFKVGDWITFTRKDGTREVLQVSDIIDGRYHFNHLLNGSWSVKECNETCHLWTIQDAKSGDVLVNQNGEMPFIFSTYKENHIFCHCGYANRKNIFFDKFVDKDGSLLHWVNLLHEKVCPATKEQRDLLFQKMKEAGYKWENNQLEEINIDGSVDLGLPSGTLWSKCNLGAEKETDLGLLFQWGDTKGYESVSEHQFSWEDYKFGSWDDLTKYNEKDIKLILENEDDPVFVATKGKFKSPTKEQLQELIDHTNHKWATIERVNGMKFWKKGTEEPTEGDSYIFIPAAGHCCNDYHYGVDSWGYVWSASRKVFDEGFAWTMKFFDRGGIDICSNCYCNGFSVRGVVAPQAETFDEIDDTDDGQPVDLGLPSGTKWMKSNIGATKPSGFGKFFQWGDTQGYSNIDEHEFNWGDYKWGTFDSIIKYNKNDHLTLLVSNDDSAFVATSGSASMPTKDQLQELIDNTEHRWLRLANGINGMKFWKKGTEEPTESNSYIFIPAAGNCYGGNHYGVGSWGSVWSVSRDESSASSAWRMRFDAGDVGMSNTYRCSGYSVRGVINR